jgi:hypothetical protein
VHTLRFVSPPDVEPYRSAFDQVNIVLRPWLANPNGDDDGDGLSNLMEGGLGTDPNAANPPPDFAPWRNSGGNLVVTFNKPQPATGFSYAFEASSELQNWGTVAVSNVFDNSATLTSVVARPPSGIVFVRLRVTAPPE